MKRFYIVFSILIVHLAFSKASNAQLVRDLHYLYNPSYFYNPYHSYTDTDTSFFSPFGMTKKGDVKYNLEVGSGFSSFMGGMTSSFVSPSISYQATNKLHVIVGGKFSHTQSTGNTPLFFGQETFNAQPYAGNPTEFFAVAHFQLNEKISLFSAGSFGKNQLYFSPFQYGLNQGDYSHFTLGMDYKISKKVRIGASFDISHGPQMGWGNSLMGRPNYHHFNPYFPF